MTREPAAPAPAIRILVVDDHPAVRQGLALLVSSEGMAVAAEASGRAQALALAGACRPDLAVVDLSLENEDGRALVTDLAARGIPALVYSMHGDAQHVEGAFAAGALGYVTKAEFRGVLVEAIRAVAAGRRFVSPRAAVALTDRFGARREHDALGQLSAQEREVHRLLGEGEGTAGIAAALRISTHTVESYYARIQVKLALVGMHELRHHAIAHYRATPR
jgi:DNA-binding NarL/FixJ family response regulator